MRDCSSDPNDHHAHMYKFVMLRSWTSAAVLCGRNRSSHLLPSSRTCTLNLLLGLVSLTHNVVSSLPPVALPTPFIST